MKILVLSDLHLCSHPIVDKFGWDEDEFIKQIESVKRDHSIDSIIINGDIEENYFFDSKIIHDKYEKLFEYFTNNRVLFTYGNHDVPKKEHLFINIGRVYIEHGDKGDFYGFTPLKKLRDFRDSILDRLYLLSSFACRQYINSFKKTSIPTKSMIKNAKTNAVYAKNILTKTNNDVVIFGHTHVFEKQEFDIKGKKKYYLNSGTCSNGKFEGIVIDTETLEITMIKKV